jgi:hypothetical protein
MEPDAFQGCINLVAQICNLHGFYPLSFILYTFFWERPRLPRISLDPAPLAVLFSHRISPQGELWTNC